MKKTVLTLLLAIVIALPVAAVAATAQAPQPLAKPVIEKQDDLPRHSYQLDIPVTALYLPENRPVLLQLARDVGQDVEADLATYDIRDANTLQGFYSTLGTIAILQGRWQDYLDLLAKRRELETKEANRLTMGIYGEALARAHIASEQDVDAAMQAQLEQLVNDLPYDKVADNIKGSKGSTEILTRDFVLGNLDASFQPIVDKTGGEISYDIASSLVGVSFTLDHYVDDKDAINAVYSAYLEANAVAKQDIWQERRFELAPDEDATPVIVSVWDSGVDTAIFAARKQLWSNQREIPDNLQDDDGNGYVDDVHGIAYDLEARKEISLLYPIGELDADEAVMQRRSKGIGDIISNIDSEEAAELRRYMATLPQTEVKEFLESLNLYGGYAHGTHVSGIALEGNPFARLLVARMTYGHKQIPEKPTLEKAQAEAQMFRDVATYFRAAGVRAVNMSWGGSLRGIEGALEAHDVGATPEERRALARKIYNIGDEALREAIAGSPDILFITSAGNADNDIRFDEFYPSSYDYPNLLTVGAVDLAGDETSFTSLGKVDIYGNGFEVESFVPGGNRLEFSGTSMSSPQVLNLAAKLLALEPELSVAELRQLIIDGAEEKALASRTIRLLNPKASLQLLRARGG